MRSTKDVITQMWACQFGQDNQDNGTNT